MIVNCGKTLHERASEKYDARTERLSNWHNFFAIWPRRVSETECAWFQLIERKGEQYVGWCQPPETKGHKCLKWRWEYRLKE